MTLRFARVQMCTFMVAAAVAAVAIFLPPVRAGAQAEKRLTLVACPAMHPSKPGVPFKHGTLGGLYDGGTKETTSGPLQYYAKDGWAYRLDDDPVLDYLICVYADESIEKYPLPDVKTRGLGRCDYVNRWNDADITSDAFVPAWPTGLDRTPMAICTFNPNAVISPDFKPPRL